MCEIPLDTEYISDLAEEHRAWLSSYGSKHLANWDRLLKGNLEAACCEAAFRRHLISLVLLSKRTKFFGQMEVDRTFAVHRTVRTFMSKLHAFSVPQQHRNLAS